jgi:hypothetical protein
MASSVSRIAISQPLEEVDVSLEIILDTFLDIMYYTFVPENDYKKALEAAQTELSDLMAKRAELDERIARLGETVNGLSYLIGHDGAAGVLGLGLTNAIRKVLSDSGRPMAPVEIRAALVAAGFDVYKYTDIIPSIHAILKRLFEAGQVVMVQHGSEDAGYTRMYLWNIPENIEEVRKGLGEVGGTIWRPAKPQPIRTPPPKSRNKQSKLAIRREIIARAGQKLREQSKSTIDPFAGQGGTPTQMNTSLSDPPYAVSEPQSKSSVTYEGLGSKPKGKK